MNDTISTALATHAASALPFISKASGVVYPIEVTTSGTTKTLPGAIEVFTNPPTVLAAGTYQPMTPDTGEKGILYFEDKGSRQIADAGKRERWTGELDAILWINTADCCGQSDHPRPLHYYICAAERAFNRRFIPDGIILNGSVEVVEQYPATLDLFRRYDYDNAENQYLILPFLYFGLRLRWNAYVNCSSGDCGPSSGIVIDTPTTPQGGNGAGMGVQADFEEIDPAEPDYVRNKPSTDYLAYYLLARNT